MNTLRKFSEVNLSQDELAFPLLYYGNSETICSTENS